MSAPPIGATSGAAAGTSRVPRLFDALSDEQTKFLLDYRDSRSGRALARSGTRHDVAGMSRNNVSDRFIKLSGALLKELNSRPLDDLNLAAIMLDGTPVGRDENVQMEIWALGITMDGEKLPLGVVEGPTESGDLTADLLRSLVDERGLDVSDCLWIIDGGSALRSGIHTVAGRRAAIQRCVVHKSRNIAWKSLPAAIRKVMGKKLREDIHAAWDEPDLEKAVEKLEDVAKRLERGGQKRAASSAREGRDMTLTLKRLMPNHRALWKALSTTNALESVHDQLKIWAKPVKLWGAAFHAKAQEWNDKRQRYFAAATASAELNWGKVGYRLESGKEATLEREALEEMTLSVVAARHPNVEMTTHVVDATVNVSRLHVAPAKQRSAYQALRELARWADRNGKTVAIGREALEASQSGEKIRQWLGRNGFVAAPEHEQAGPTAGSFVRAPRPRGERASDVEAERSDAELDGGVDGLDTNDREALAPTGSDVGPARTAGGEDGLGWIRDAVGDELLVAVGERALELGPTTVGMSDSELQAQVAEHARARAGLASVENDVRAWGQTNWKDAAWRVALEREGARRGGRPFRDPLDEHRRLALGEAGTRWIEGESRFLAGWIEDAPDQYLADHAQRVRGAFDGLDAQVERVDRAARVCAAKREIDRREQLRAIAERLAAAPTPGATTTSRRSDAVSLPERYGRALGTRRQGLLTRYTEALAPQLRGLDDATLEDLRRELGQPWSRLDAASGLRTARTERHRDTLSMERGGYLHEAGRRSRVAEDRQTGWGIRTANLERAEVCRAAAGKLGGDLRAVDGDLAGERAKPGSVGRFLLEHPEAALDAAVDMELGRRAELRRAQEPAAPHMEAPAIKVASPELAAGVGM